jgi:rare lipoprotein A
MGDAILPGRGRAVRRVLDTTFLRAGRTAAGLMVLGLVGFVAGGCATHSRQGPATLEGVASWYGPGFHGQRTASGERYDQYRLTAAHRSWPLGTHARVTNLENGRSVTVRINDRGPYVDGRVLDLSYAAARALDMVGSGTGNVRIEPLLEIGEPLGVVGFAVQVAAFADAARARAYRDDVASLAELRGGSLSQPRENVYVVRDVARPVHRVRVGPYTQRGEAEIIAASLERRGVEAIVVEEVLPPSETRRPAV